MTMPPDRRANAAMGGIIIARILLAFYAGALLVIAVLPVPVDRGVAPLLQAVLRRISWLEYRHVEFGANILLFVPLGLLLAVMVSRRYVVVPTAMVVTVSIESVQSVALEQRTSSVLDIIANVTGACIGLLLVEVFEWWQQRRE